MSEFINHFESRYGEDRAIAFMMSLFVELSQQLAEDNNSHSFIVFSGDDNDDKNKDDDVREPSLFTFKKYEKNDDKEMSECEICLDFLINDQEIVEIDSCQHIFHKHCFEEWLKKSKTCVKCRQRLV